MRRPIVIHVLPIRGVDEGYWGIPIILLSDLVLLARHFVLGNGVGVPLSLSYDRELR